MIFIESKSRNPYYNLALEEFVFSMLDRNESYFMLWQNSNTIVVGKFQNTIEEINPEAVDANDIKVVRRLSGGGAVYHDDGNLNFTFIVTKEGNKEFDFCVFVEPIVKALSDLGVYAEFTGRNDITIDGLKISGNSQYIKNGRVLHHGCIMLDSNLDKVKDALAVREAKFESRSVKSVRSRVTTINANAPRKISMEEFKEAIKRNVFLNGEVREYQLTEDDEREIERLMHEKYETWEWNYGFSKKYKVRHEKKFDSGLVSVDLDVEHGKVSDIKISGDFFGSEEILELEEKIKGLQLDDELEGHLVKLDIGKYIHGVSAGDLARLMK
ncbi:MAG: lipoate--protein ligase [Firmicutes bacterium]|nr:lipoate--protein ligase [Bacillota bacterium]